MSYNIYFVFVYTFYVYTP